MAKVYEALRRAEEERKRKAQGQETPVVAVEWDSTPATAPPPRRRGRVRSWFGRRSDADAVAGAGGATDMNKRRISLLQPESYVAEQFRVLRGRIDSLAAERPIKSVAITSPNANEGKSTAAINLATVTAMSVGSQVLLMDCDLRRPSVHRSLGLEPQLGLAEVLRDEASMDEAVLKMESLNLDVLAVRGQPSNPSELLASARMRSLVEEASDRYDRIILDTPATLGVPDAKIVSELCDGLVMVVRAGVTPREHVEAALDVLDRRRLLGLVLNGAERGGEREGYY